MLTKRNLFLLLLCLTSSLCLASNEPTPPEIEDPSCIAINKLPARSSFAYPCKDELQSLNGDWTFHWSPDPQSRPVGFYADDYDRSEWSTIKVPSTMERQGYGVTQYTNSTYPFKPQQPNVMLEPDVNYTSYIIRNPVGSFYREFTISPKWNNKQIILHFAGMSSAAFVWVNGQKVGYSQGSRLPSEFDITEYLRKGTNSVAVELYKYSDGSYLEDQDYWRLSGIYRDVFLTAKSKQALWDVYAEPRLNKKDKSGEIILHYNTSNLEGKGAAQIAMSLYSCDGELIGNCIKKKINIYEKGIGEYKKFSVIKLPKVELWYEEQPRAYALKVELIKNGESIEEFTLPVGFRYIDIQNKNVITYNDIPLKIKGVNRHEFSPSQGWVISSDEMVQDIELMKQGNVNFVRTSHYPNENEWYLLCNKYGMMVMDEANVESHGLSYHKRVLPADDPAWTAAVVDRMKRMVIRDRQHPSVMMWSLGNEAGFGDAYFAMREVTHKYDPEHRLIQYADMNLAADVDSRTYPTVQWLREQVLGIAKQKGERGETEFPDQHGKYPTGKPFITNEFAHAMGNSLGNFKEFYDVFYKEPMLGGGFIWDWVDQSLWIDPANGDQGLIYGGDNGDYPNDKNMLVNGIVNSSREPNPHYYEMQKVFQSIAINQIAPKGRDFEIINRFYKHNLEDFDFTYEVLTDGEISDHGTLQTLSAEPYEIAKFTLPSSIEFDEKSESFITLKFLLKEDKLWAKRGSVVAWEQFKLTDKALDRITCNEGNNNINLKENDGKFICSGDGFIVSISKDSGMIDGFYKDGFPMIFRPASFDFYRVPTDNDNGWKMPTKMAVWKQAEEEHRVESVKIVDVTPSKVTIRSSFDFAQAKSSAVITYTITGDGSVEVDFMLDMNPDATALSCMGLQFDVHQNLEQIEWYGRGEHECYIDRQSSAAIGTYTANINDWITSYVRPQTNANRTDIRHITFTSATNKSLKFTALDKPFEASAWPYSSEMLEHARHDFELGRYNGNTINILGAQQGVGGDNSWGLPIMPEYQLAVQNYRLHFILN